MALDQKDLEQIEKLINTAVIELNVSITRTLERLAEKSE